jgi:CheY-like chemotaxis protein
MQGYEVFESPNGKIAIGLLQQQPKLIMLDLGLPDIAGHDLLRQIGPAMKATFRSNALLFVPSKKFLFSLLALEALVLADTYVLSTSCACRR